MKQYLFIIKEIFLLRESPQVIPSSIRLMLLTISATLLLNLFTGSFIYPVKVNLGRSLFEVALLLLFIQFALQYSGHKERFNQTATILFFVQFALNLLALPIIMNLSSQLIQESSLLNALLGLFLLMLLMYSVIIMSHVLKYAMSAALQKAVFVSIAYHFVSIVLVSFMFPSPSV